MDMLFLFFIVLCFYLFFYGVCKDKKELFVYSGISAFFAVFTKGAFGIILPALAFLVFILTKEGKKGLRGYFVFLFASLLLIALWLLSFSLVQKGYFQRMLFVQTFNRAITPTSHKAPFYFYLAYFVPVFFPWSLYVFFMRRSFRINRKIPSFILLHSIWIVCGIFVLSLCRTKNPMYLLILAPSFISAGMAVFNSNIKLRSNISYGAFVALFTFLFAGKIFFGNMVPFVAVVFFVILFFALLFYGFKKGDFSRPFAIGWAVVLAVSAVVVLPIVSRNQSLHKLADKIKNINVSYNNVCVYKDSLLALSLYGIKNVQLCPRPAKNSLLVVRRQNSCSKPVAYTRRFVVCFLE